MNKLNVILLALAVLGCVMAMQCRADPEQEQELENEIEEGDEEVDDSPDGGIDFGNFRISSKDKEKKKGGYWGESVEEQWGDDIIHHGIPKVVKGRQQACAKMTTESSCRACCREQGKESKWSTDLKRALKLSSVKTCVCTARAPSVTPN